MSFLSKYVLPIIVLTFGCIISFLVTYTINNLENDEIKHQFSINAAAHFATIEQTLDDNLSALANLKAFFDSSDFVSRQEFKTLTSPYLLTHKHVQALEWIPVVKKSTRSDFEILARADGFENFEFKQRGADGGLEPVSERDIYYPVYYVEPLEGNTAALGFDLGSNKNRLMALQKSIDSGAPVATAPINLVQETEQQSAVLIFVPIYNHQYTFDENAVYTVTERRKNIKGFGLLVLRIGDLISSSIDHFHTQNIISIDDISEPKNTLNMFRTSQNIEYEYLLQAEKTLNIAGRDWRIMVFPESDSYLLNNDRWLWLIFALGITSTLILAYYLVQMINREDIIRREVTEKTQRLTDSENKANMILDTAVEAIITVTRDGYIKSFNAAATELYGYEEQDIIGKNYSQLIFEGQELPADELAKIIKTLEKVVEVKCLKSNGDVFAGELTHSNFVSDGQELYSFFLRDISKRKNMEEDQKELINQLNESNTDLQRFAYVASHDLQEPLRMVSNFTELLRKEYGSQLDENAQQYMNISVEAAQRMQNLVADLLDYSKVGADIEAAEEIDCKKILEYIQENLQNNIRKTGAKIQYDNLPKIYASASTFTSLLQNLISNSIKYKIKDRDPIIEISATEAENSWIFSVKDNGIGIDEKYFTSIFEPFQRLHTRKEFSGTGIGLAICARIVDKLGGRIWVESEVGKGANFYFEIPKNSNNSETA